MKKQIIIHYKRKKIKIIAKDCNFVQKFVGLMFSCRKKAEILLFNFKSKQKIRIHSFFVFYSFIAVWLDDKNKVVDLKIVKPFVLCVSPKGKCFKLVEIPINKNNKRVINWLLPTRFRKI